MCLFGELEEDKKCCSLYKVSNNDDNFIIYLKKQNFQVDICSVCKKDKKGSSIETLPSSFSHLYSSSLQEPGPGGDIPRCQQVSSCSCRSCAG